MRPSLALWALMLAPTMLIAEENEDGCIPHGETCEFEACRPSLKVGYPTSSEWLGEDSYPPQAFDDDAFSDDSLGTADLDPETGCASISISNANGNLYGPNGDFVNGLADGDCIEVYMDFYYRYKAKRTECKRRTQSVGGEGGGVSTGHSTTTEECLEIEYWVLGRVRVSVAEVCAC